MKILIVGEDRYPIYEKAFQGAFVELGHECKIFGWQKHTSKNTFLNKVENKFLWGPSIKALNQELYDVALSFNPDLIFLYRAVMIYPKTLKQIKKTISTKIFTYHNDDPFSKTTPRYMNRHFIRSLPFCDWIFSYRFKNIEDYQQLGYKNVSLLRSYYLKEKNFPISNIKKIYDVLFVGHFEDDGRDEYILHLLENNIKVKLFGTNWEASRYHKEILEKTGLIKAVYDSKYNIAINQAKIALVFLSKLNNDTYTRRCFEIPATKTAMFSVYTEDLAGNLFQESNEVEYFRDKDELLMKTIDYLSDENRYKELGMQANQRLLNDGHEVRDRIKNIVGKYIEINNE